MKRLLWIIGLFSLVLSACAAPTPQMIAVPGGPPLVMAAPNATATPTPFQPSQPTPLATITSAPPFDTSTPLPSVTPLVIAPLATPTIEFLLTPVAMPALGDNDSINFLLLGSDSRGGGGFRTDILIVAVVWPKRGQVSLISIPRDLWVNIPEVGMQRINTAYQSGTNYPGGGAGLLKDTIMFNLGIRIDHTALVDFNGFRQIVDTLGGIDVPVFCAYTDWRLLAPTLDPELESSWGLYTINPGLIHMDGDLALWYARSRKRSSDLDRGRRSQEVLRAIYSKGLQADAIRRIPDLYTQFNDTVTTDVGLNDLLALAPLALHLSNADIRSYYINGPYITPWTTPGGAAVLLPNIEMIQIMLQQALTPSEQKEVVQTYKIEVQNGSPTDGYDALAAERLNYAGYETSLAKADNREHPLTLLYDLTAEQDGQRLEKLKALFGLSDANVVKTPGFDYPSDYVLIVGADFQPCFRPDQLAP
jgi:LCP family protein required for cell wall assembly